MFKSNPVLSSTSRVLKQSKDVSLNLKKIENLAEDWSRAQVVAPEWQRGMHFETRDIRRLLDYVIILDSLNFCFWAKEDEDKWRIEYEDIKHSGYFALALALKKFFETHPDKSNFKYLADISFQEFSKVFEGEGTLLLIKKRWEIAQAVSRTIVEKYSGNSERVVLSGSHKTSKLVSKIAKDLPSFNDEATYNGRKVYFWKRAQILVSDVYGITDGCGIGYFEDLEYLTAFPDYKLPQILNHWGIIEYSPKLLKKIREKEFIKAGSKEEVEIRSATVWAVEYIKEELLKRGKKMRSFEIDWLLWNESKRIQMNKPHHLTQTVFY